MSVTAAAGNHFFCGGFFRQQFDLLKIILIFAENI
jgi:hypothetical protein